MKQLGTLSEDSRRLVWMGALCLLFGCAAPDKHVLRPPADRSMAADRENDISECVVLAKTKSGMPLSSEEREQLAGRDTIGFLYAGRASVDGKTLTPIRRDTYLKNVIPETPPRNQSDHYVVCMLRKGYRWDTDGKWSWF